MSDIKLVTDIPGPISRALAQRAGSSVAAPLVPYGEVFAAGGQGAILEDVDGNRFIDLIGGVGCLITGHSHPKVVEAIKHQTERFIHTDFSLIPYEPYVELAERLSALCGGGRKAGFFNSGAEAVENAVKVAKKATGRTAIICFEGAFHGRTLMAMTLTAREVPYKQGFGPFAPDVHRAPYPGFGGATVASALEEVERLMRTEQIAGLIVEPVLGEGGFIVPSPEFLPALAEMCRDHGAMFIADEIQSGYCRTGNFLASEQVGVRPDLVVLGKSIACGFPLSAIVADPAWIDRLPSNSLGGTYVGNPIACAAALAVLDVIEQERLIERAVMIGNLLRDSWERLASQTPAIAEVRGAGAMIGVEFEDPAVSDRVVRAALKRGVMSMKAGPDGRVIRHLMPLVITEDQVTEAMAVFESCLLDA